MFNPFTLFVTFFATIGIFFKIFIIFGELVISLMVFLFSLIRKDKKEDIKNTKEFKNDK